MILQKQYKNHYGLDLKSSDIDRPDQFARDVLNAQYAKSGTIQKRKGFKARSSSTGGHGIFTYKMINPSDVSLTQTLVSVSDKLHKLNEATLTISYSGAEPVSLLSIYYSEAELSWVFEIKHELTTVFSKNLGIGFDEASTYSMSSLSTEINLISGYTSTVVGLSTTPASFFENISSFDLKNDGAKSVKAYYWTDVNCPIASPFAGSETNKNSTEFENVSFCQLNNVLFISNGYDELQKYDGQTCYRAGLPLGPVPTLTNAGAGLVELGNHYYYCTYEQVDNVGNIIESDESTALINLAVASTINVQVNNILASSGYNTACAVVAGAQTLTSVITVDNGSGGQNTFNIGDKAYFYDSVSASYVTRNITGRSTTTITINGAAVTVSDNIVISNNLKINIYRSEAGGTVTFKVESIPNNSFTANQTYIDNKADASLGVEYLVPIKTHGPPPKGKYITPYYNQLVIAGSLQYPNVFSWSDIDSPEYFPIGDNFELAQSYNGDPITGIKQSNEVLCVFESNATHVYSGDFVTNNISHEITSHSIGCSSFHSIQQVEQEIVFLSNKGVYSIVSGQIPLEQSKFIQPYFIQNSSVDETEVFIKKRAVGFIDTEHERYILYIPTESASGVNKYGNDNYKILVLDYSHNSEETDNPRVWLKWNFFNTNPLGGMTKYNDVLWFQERRYSGYNSSVDHILYSFLNNNNEYDYADNIKPIIFEYKTAWYSIGEPSVFKYYNRLKLFYIPENIFGDVTLNIETEKDYTIGLVVNSLSVNLLGNGGGYGISPYGSSPYGAVNQPNIKTKLGGKFKSMCIIFTNSDIYKGIELTGWELEASDPFSREIKE